MSEPRDWTPETLAALGPDEIEAAVRVLLADDADVAPLLAGAAELAADRVVRKALRRGLHQLRSRGHAVPERSRGSGSVLRPVAEDRDLAFVSPVGPQGRRFAVLIVFERGGAQVYQLVCSDQEGVLRIDDFRGKRGDARRFARDLRTRAGDGPTEIEADALRALLRGYHAGRAPAPGVDAHALAQLLEGPDTQTPGDQVRALFADPELSEREADEILRERARAGAAAEWPLDGESLEETARALLEVEQSPLVLSELQKRQRASELIDERLPRLLDAASRERLAARLEETGALWLARGDEQGARAAVRVAGQVRGEGPPLAVPYLRGLVDRSLESVLTRLRDTAKNDLIVKA
jgi:hypothetical protein